MWNYITHNIAKQKNIALQATNVDISACSTPNGYMSISHTYLNPITVASAYNSFLQWGEILRPIRGVKAAFISKIW